MNKGSLEITVQAGSTITIKSSGQFCAYGVEKKKRSLILGPININQRILRYKLPPEISTVYVKTEKSTEWTLEAEYYNRSEVLDNTPIEIPVGYELPESLADQMRRFIREEVSAARDEDQGSFEDEDDFEDDEPLLTNFELTDMQEVEEILREDTDQPPAEKEAETAENPPQEDAKKPVPSPEAVDTND